MTIEENKDDTIIQAIDDVLECHEECKGICCRNGGGEACINACGCKGPCKKSDDFKMFLKENEEEDKIEDINEPEFCIFTCKMACCRAGAGADCVKGCGCKGECM